MTWREIRDLKLTSETTWARVEGSPRADRPDEALAAQIGGGPFWLVARQWALGELQGDDAASPITAELTTRAVAIGTPRSSSPSTSLLEAEIEGEPYPVDLRIRVQAGNELKRLLGDDDLYAELLARPDLRVPDLPDPDEFPEQGQSLIADDASHAFLLSVQDRVVDGYAVLERHQQGNLPEELDTPEIKQSLDELVAWFGRTYTVFPISPASNWIPSSLEYQAGVYVDDGHDSAALHVDDYLGGRLDWWNFDLQPPIEWNGIAPRTDVTLPTTVEFPGMPMSRYWELEDWRIDFGQITAARTDLSRLLLIEFALVYGEDWFSIPLQGPRGSLIRIDKLEVVNTFGERFVVAPAGRPSALSWDRWSTGHPSITQNVDSPSAEELAEAQRIVAFPPATLSSTAGAAIEEVIIARDEMANLLWGIEVIATNHLGDPSSVVDFWGDHLTTSPPEPDEPGLHYSLMTSVPRNWYPFAPLLDTSVSPARATALERVPFLRSTPSGDLVPVLPLGSLLGRDDPPNSDRYRLAEEAVNRMAQRIVRRFERARAPDGRTHLWVANHRVPTQPQKQSGLRFDVLTNVGQEGQASP
jgi:hypothetical protein